ncbi:MAG: hypothetical protein WCH29_10400 [Chitinophagaceae bacterium]
MKQIIILITGLIFSSVVVAQSSSAPSSVYDVPANKIKPDYDKAVAVKPIVVATKVTKLPSSSVVIVTDKNSSTYVSDKPVTIKAVNPIDNSGSVANQVPVKATTKAADISGSVIDVTPVKTVAKPVVKPTQKGSTGE